MMIRRMIPILQEDDTFAHPLCQKKYMSSSDPHSEALLRHGLWHTIWKYIRHIYFQTIWHFFWHILCHSILRSVWHLFRRTLWYIFWHSIWNLASTPTFYLPFFHSFILTFFLAYVPGICIWHSFWHSIWYIFRNSLWLRSGRDHSDPEVAVRVRRDHCDHQPAVDVRRRKGEEAEAEASQLT